MAVTDIGRPFAAAEGRYWVESSFGSGESTTTLPISCKILDVRIDTGDRIKDLRGITSPLVCHFLEQVKEPVLHIEYIPQEDDTLIEDVIDRIQGCCSLQSLAFDFGANVCYFGTQNATYYHLKGCKPSTCRISSSRNTEVVVAVDFMVQSVTTSTTSTGWVPTALTGDYCWFNGAGDITKTDGHVVLADEFAFITDSYDLTFTHQLTRYTSHNETTCSYIIEGEMNVEGTVDISLDGGGGLHWAEVMNNNYFAVTIDLGGTGGVRISLPSCKWVNGSVDLNLSGEAMISNEPFRSKPSACWDIIQAVP